MVSWNVATGVLAGVDFIQQKSIHEGSGIPVAEANVATVRIGKQILKMLEHQRLGETEELKLEEHMMRLEVKAMVDKVIELGNGDIAIGEVKAAEVGVLDLPFPAWSGAMSKVVPVRDRYGVNRYLDPGNLPIPAEVMEYHRKMISERAREEGLKADLELLIKDAYRISGPVAPEGVKG